MAYQHIMLISEDIHGKSTYRPIIRGLSDFKRQKMIAAGNLPVRRI